MAKAVTKAVAEVQADANQRIADANQRLTDATRDRDYYRGRYDDLVERIRRNGNGNGHTNDHDPRGT